MNSAAELVIRRAGCEEIQAVHLATGLLIGPFVDVAVKEMLHKLGQGENASLAEVTFIGSELLRQLNRS